MVRRNLLSYAKTFEGTRRGRGVKEGQCGVQLLPRLFIKHQLFDVQKVINEYLLGQAHYIIENAIDMNDNIQLIEYIIIILHR